MFLDAVDCCSIGSATVSITSWRWPPGNRCDLHGRRHHIGDIAPPQAENRHTPPIRIIRIAMDVGKDRRSMKNFGIMGGLCGRRRHSFDLCNCGSTFWPGIPATARRDDAIVAGPAFDHPQAAFSGPASTLRCSTTCRRSRPARNGRLIATERYVGHQQHALRLAEGTRTLT